MTADNHEALKAALQALYDEQNGPPLERDKARWQAAMDRARELLTDETRTPGKQA